MTENLKIAIQAAVDAGRKVLEIYNDEGADFMVEAKSDNSPITIADKASHALICDMLLPLGLPLLSEEGLLHDFATRSQWDSLWIVDPLDGTKEFIKRNGDFTINIAKVDGGMPTLGVVYVPVTGELYYAEQGSGCFKCSSFQGLDSLEECSERLPLAKDRDEYVVAVSISHFSDATKQFVESKERELGVKAKLLSRGSSLKFCLVAEGEIDLYPRFSPTMEWDTAAGDALLRVMGRAAIEFSTGEPLQYNKPDLLNPDFIVE